MDKNKVQGAMDDATGRVKRQVGEWTGDTGAQMEGAAQQMKGKLEKALGKLNDAAKEAEKKAEREHREESEESHVYAINRNSR
ncbi:MAG: CsbD family protein [Acidobacteriota bacterium]|nr:CsbD family protein [Acidobacteriota bacterium]